MPEKYPFNFYDPQNLPKEPVPPTEETTRRYEEWLEQRRLVLTHYRQRRRAQQTIDNPYVWQAGELKPYTLHLSDHATINLKRLATKYHYGHHVGDHARHAYLSLFLRSLANPAIRWIDNREPILKEADPIRIQYGLLPLWVTQDTRFPRMGRRYWLTADIFEDFYQLALYHGILSLANRPTRINPGTAVSAFFEIVGLNLLIPDPNTVPTNPNEQSWNRPYQKPPKDYTTPYPY